MLRLRGVIRRPVAVVAVLAMGVSLLTVPLVTAEANPPPNPSNQALKNAASTKAAVAQEVGKLSAQVAQMQAEIQRLNAKAELAEQRLALALSQLQQAKDAAAAARARVDRAQAAVDSAQTQFAQFVSITYTTGGVTGGAGDLLTATDPNALLQRQDYAQYAADHQLNAIGDLQRATVEKSNADAAARLAVKKQQEATDAAQRAKQAAEDALAQARAVQQQLRSSLSAKQNQLQQARLRLATLQNQRATYLAWQAEQARLARIRAAQEAARRRAAAEAAARAAAAARSGQGLVSVPIAPSSGGWSAGAAQTAVNRAMAYLGWPYSFAAGDFSGPTYGVAVDFASRNDGGVYGFDCSGLVLYAWAPYIHLDHYAATQYWQAGSYHPSGDLRPGDLVFWSSDGTQAGIHHVAMYIGGGNVIQAPFSGSFIQVTPLGQVDSGYYGATRPLT